MHKYHVTYRKAGLIEVGRVMASSRSAALSEAALKFGVRRSAVQSAVKLPKPVCGFCHGRPVSNAAAWVSLDAPKHAPCPRCGAEPPA